MSTVTRTWLAFAALGTGMIHLALVLGSPLPVGVALVIFGIVEIAWAVLTFRRDTVAAPRLVLLGALLPILLWGMLLLAATSLNNPEVASSLSLTAMGLAALLELFAAAVIAVQLRRGVDFSAPSRTPKAGVYLAGLFVGGMLVAAITTPALAATEAGLYAQPHGEHSDSFTPRVDETEGITFNIPEHPGH
ncbi:MAG: hypothetical protein ABWY54_04915 [Glaciihabitans sp.]